jgi:hypothetical protein
MSVNEPLSPELESQAQELADEDTRQRVGGDWFRLLEHEGGARVLEILEAFAVSR